MINYCSYLIKVLNKEQKIHFIGTILVNHDGVSVIVLTNAEKTW